MIICPSHTPEFLTKHGLGVEAHITRHDTKPNWSQYIPFVQAIHLPYRIPGLRLNFAAFDDEHRKYAIGFVKDAIDEGCKYNIEKMVIHTMGIESDGNDIVGCYDRMIEGLREIIDYAGDRKKIICIENQLLHTADFRHYGSFAYEWYQILKDVDRSNAMLTLDTSHASTTAAVFATAEERFKYIYEYLKHPELIGRVHWSDSRLTNREAYFNDMHLVPGLGDLPRDFHQRIKALDAEKTLEQSRPESEVEQGLKFIESL